MSLLVPVEVDLESIRVTAASLLECDVATLEPIGGGRNSQVFRLEDMRARRFAIKLYFRHLIDGRDRMGTEFSAFSFLWKSSVRQVPQPIACDPKIGFAIYEYVEGLRAIESGIQKPDVETAIEFARTLHGLRSAAVSEGFGPASEACFSAQAIEENLRQRLHRLGQSEGTSAALKALQNFLSGDLSPELERIVSWSRRHLESSGLSFAEELGVAERTLSPSDFGFHNALRRPAGNIVFLDFEYFGWDDPAKMVADFLLHPAMELSPEFRTRFASGIVKGFGGPPLARRIEAVYPLFGIKWCLILLNEFLPADLARRQFASRGELDRDALQMKQLDKAKRMLHRISEEYERFPYFE